jgi:hypothetical protein
MQEVNQTHNTNATHKIDAAPSTNVLLQARESNEALPSTKVGATAKTQESQLAALLERVSTGQDKMNEIMNLAMSGKQFSPSELIGIQAMTYQFTQELDLVSKVVEKATSGIKQTLNTQV